MSKKKRATLQSIIQKRQQAEFVGRSEQLELFRTNLARSWDDEQRLFLFNVYGQGGVGKSTLLQRFRQIAGDNGAVTAWVDEQELDVPAVLARFATQLKSQGHELKYFEARYKTYRQKRDELEADPDAPQGFAAFAAGTLTKATAQVVRHTVPGSGIVLDLVDEDTLSAQAGDWAEYVRRWLTNKDEVQLLLKPVETLTPLFLNDMGAIAEDKTVVLFFDTYERTGVYLDGWLRDLLTGRYGDVPADIILVVAGRDELDRDRWLGFEGVMARFSLEPFSDGEARAFLLLKGIIDDRTIDVILRLSGRFPLLVATLAAESPDDPSQIEDGSSTAITRFLKWVPDLEHRQIASRAALPRKLNQDILHLIAEANATPALFDWLRRMPFVQRRGDGWVYHEVVRTQMLRHQQRESPQTWANLHAKVAEHYEAICKALNLSEAVQWHNTNWQNNALEVLYHRLCQATQGYMPTALHGFLRILQTGSEHQFTGRWLGTMRQVEDEMEARTFEEKWGHRLEAAMQAYDSRQYEKVIPTFKALLRQPLPDPSDQSLILTWLGRTYRDLEMFDESVATLNQAIEINPNNIWAIGHRGRTFARMEEYGKSLVDFMRQLEIVPDHFPAIYNQAVTRLQMGHYQDAVADFNQAAELSPESKDIVANRGNAYMHLGQYQSALADFNRALQLRPDYAYALAMRGETYRLLGQYEAALADFERAVALEPVEHEWVKPKMESVREILQQKMGARRGE